MNKFTLAKPIYVKGLSGVMNAQAGFVCTFDADAAKAYSLYITGQTYYHIYLNGETIHHGPARGPHGFVRCDTLPLPIKPGRNILAISVAGYNCPSFYSLLVPSFLQAELSENGEIIAYTGRDFKATSLVGVREQKVLRYSYQRTFTEVWRLNGALSDWMSGNFEPMETEEVAHGQDYIERAYRLPYMGLTPPASLREAGTYALRHNAVRIRNRFMKPGPDVVSFKAEEFADDVVGDTDADFTPDAAVSGALTAGQYAAYDLGQIYAGFVRTHLRVLEPSTVYVVFAERYRNGRIDYGNGDCSWINIIKYELPVGEIQLESFEPYSLKYVGVMVHAGKVEVLDVNLREYAYPVTKPEVKIDDPMLRAAYDAAFEGFRQNTVDCFMDSPGRERGGWLCDSYFTAEASYFFTGDSECERAFLDNFRLPERFDPLPSGLLPMCYPASNLENSIPQWTMWYVYELGEFVNKRGGDPAPFRPLLAKILAFFESYENEDGLLEKLPLWNFVEWSRANQWVQDVNYPTNMLYYRILHVFAQVLERPELLEKAAHVKAEVIRQAYVNGFFQDHAVRGEDGKLKLCGDYSAICQHEAVWFGVADAKDPAWAELIANLVKGCGPDGDRSLLLPDMEPLDLFPGLLVRTELLHALGEYERNLKEIAIMFGERMAASTGTLWEHCDGHASLNHGIASAIARIITQSLEKLGK